MRKNNKKIISFLVICFLTLGILNFGSLSPRILEINEDSPQPKTADTDLKVAILDSTSTPSYLSGSLLNDYVSMYNGLASNGFDPINITNADILADILETVDVLVLVDNLPSDAASATIRDWALKGGGILSFDSSIELLNWAGIIPPEANGTNGEGTYWTYNSPAYGIVVNDDHPVMNGYSYGDNINGSQWDSRYYSDAIMTSSAGPYYTPLVKQDIDSNFDFVVALDAPYCGRVVHIWDEKHWNTTSNQQMILNGINWIRDKFADVPVDVGINEVHTGNPDWIELYNYGPSIDMTGWYIEAYQGTFLDENYTFPSGWMFNSHQVVVIHELPGADTSTDLHINSNIGWTTGAVAVGLFDDMGVNIDWFETYDSAQPLPSGGVWINDTVIDLNDNYAYRINNVDTDKASDWKTSASGSEGFLNPGQIPFEFKTITGPVAIFQDAYPWGYNSTDEILDLYGISYDIYNSSDFGVVDLSPYQKVIISSKQSQTFYDMLDGNVTWFENYATNGGILEIHACDSPGGANWHSLYSMPGGLNATGLTLDDVDITMIQHPIIINPNAVNDTVLDGWGWSAHGHFDTFPLGSREILQHTSTSDPILLEFAFGNGYIIASMQTLEYAYYNNLAGSEILENIILYDPSTTYFADTLTVETPNGLSLWYTDTLHDIEWVTTGNVSNVKIELYRGGVFELEITANIANNGEFSWLIPLSLIDSTQYQIKVTDVSNPSTYDYSQYFEIYDLTLTVTSPVSSSVWIRGTENTISWTSTGILANVKIELFLNDTFAVEINASTPNDGDYSWTLPSDLDPSTLYQIKLTDVSNALIYDFSNYFEVAIPSVEPPPGIPGYNLVIFIASFVGVSILLLKKKLKTK